MKDSSLCTSGVVRALVLVALATTHVGCGGGDDGEGAGVVMQPIGFCGDGSTGVRGLVCGVGEADGKLAIHHGGRWFALSDDDGSWRVLSDVSASFRPIAPVDTTTVTPADSCQCTTRADCISRCGSARPPQIRVESRRFTVPIGGRTFEIEARESIFDEAIQPSCVEELRMRNDLVFEVRTTDRTSGNPWTIILTPRRIALGTASAQSTLNEIATEPTTPGQTGSAGTLVATPNVMVSPDVEIMSAVTTGASGRDEESVASNPALQRALDLVLAADPSFQTSTGLDDSTRQELVHSNGSTASRSRSPSSVLYDLTRATDFFMDTKRGQAGWSNKANDRPAVDASGKRLVFRRGAAVDRTVRFPFLAGICGLEASFGAFVRSELSTGRRTCFDGLPITEASGLLETGVRAGAGLGCNIVVASASAGIEATASAYARFHTRVQEMPPRLTAHVALRSRIALQAYFRTRVLFWTKKWEGRIAGIDLVSRERSFDLSPWPTAPSVTGCGDVASGGDCSDPSAVCDVTDRCVRYDGGPEGAPVRVDVGPCNSLAGGRPRGQCYPQAVELYQADVGETFGNPFCSGTLIDNDKILTAGHCLFGHTSAAQIFVKDKNGFPITGKRFVRHPAFDACRKIEVDAGGTFAGMYMGTSIYDVAVLQLNGGIGGVIPAQLDSAWPWDGTLLTTVGFGWGSGRNGDMATFETDGSSGSEILLVKGRAGATLMPGDSGGPLFREVGCGGTTSAPRVHGVVSSEASATGLARAASVGVNSDFITRAMRGESFAPAECCPSSYAKCTLPNGAQGRRSCNAQGRLEGECRP